MSRVIDGKTKLCAVLGDPISHTLSPAIHNYLAEILDVNLVYVPFHVTPQNLADSIRGAHSLGIWGMNVTIPHKERVMASLDRVEEDAQAIGAVNTVVHREDGYHGCNTDWSGLARALEDENISLKGKNVLFLGAGGVANAAAYLCGVEEAASVTILNRTLSSAQALSKRMGQRFPKTTYTAGIMAEWKELTDEKYLCIQTTPVGMYPNVDEAVIEDSAFYEKLSVAVDLIYRPGNTRYMKLAKAAGAKVCNGLGMFVYQAAEAFTMFTGMPVPKEAAEGAEKLLEEILADET